jgi:release factor glutamine methyltransferase
VSTIKEIIFKSNISRLEAELLIAHAMYKPREFVLMHPEFRLTRKQENKITKLFERRQAGEPLAYLIGHKEFRGLDFLVNEHTLIPRPVTEMMVEEASARFVPGTVVIDIGTGSGCIIISLVKTLNQESTCLPARQGIMNQEFWGTDISQEALMIAKKNVKLNKVEGCIKFKHGNLLEPILATDFMIHDSKFILLANLPYLTPTQVKNSPSIKYEPKSALISGRDGLKHYRELFKQIKKFKLNNFTLLCEIDDTQGKIMTALIKKELPQTDFEIKKDLGGYDRLAVIKSK